MPQISSDGYGNDSNALRFIGTRSVLGRGPSTRGLWSEHPPLISIRISEQLGL